MPRALRTTITLPSSLVERLKRYKDGRRSYADVLEELMDSVPPKAFLVWAEKEFNRPGVDYLTIRKNAGFV